MCRCACYAGSGISTLNSSFSFVPIPPSPPRPSPPLLLFLFSFPSAFFARVPATHTRTHTPAHSDSPADTSYTRARVRTLSVSLAKLPATHTRTHVSAGFVSRRMHTSAPFVSQIRAAEVSSTSYTHAWIRTLSVSLARVPATHTRTLVLAVSVPPAKVSPTYHTRTHASAFSVSQTACCISFFFQHIMYARPSSPLLLQKIYQHIIHECTHPLSLSLRRVS